MKKPVLILDVDGVIRNILPAILECYNKTAVFPVSKTDLKQYDLDFITDKKAFFIEHGERIFRNSPMFPETKSALEIILHEFNVVFATSQFEENEGYTVDWFENHGLPTENISFTWNKKIHNGDIFIDDCPDNLKDHSAQNCLLFDACYNRDCKDYPRVYSLFHFLFCMKNLDIIK